MPKKYPVFCITDSRDTEKLEYFNNAVDACILAVAGGWVRKKELPTVDELYHLSLSYMLNNDLLGMMHTIRALIHSGRKEK